MSRDVFVLFRQDIDECMSDPCQNNGTCMDHINAFTCDCTPGFEGLVCETVSPTGNKSLFI